MEGEEKLNKFLRTDLAARLISVVLAIVVWIYVVILIEPDIDIYYNDLPVIYTNTLALSNQNLVLVNEKPYTVSLTLRGSRNILSQISKDDITAYIDLSSYGQNGTFSAPILVRLPYEEVSVVSKKPFNASIIINELVTQTFPVTIEFTGEPADGFLVYESIPSQQAVEVTGPTEMIASIEKAVAFIDVTNADSLVTSKSELSFFNTNQDIITGKHLKYNPETIEIRTEILKSKRVPVIPVLSAEDESRFTVDIVINSFVTIFGEPSDLEGIDTIYTETINTAGSTQNQKITAELILPSRIMVLDSISEVTVDLTEKD